MNHRKKVVITGGNGYIGGYVIKELSKYNIDIVAITRDKSLAQSKKSNVKYVYMDIASPPSEVMNYLDNPEILIHLAWGGLPHYNSPYHYEIELPLQYKFLKQIILEGIESVFITGTCLEYGMKYGPLSPELNTSPVTSYGLAKDLLRKELLQLKLEKEFKITWARLFYMYGEGQGDGSLYSQFISAVDRGDKEFNMSKGDQLRDYLHVTDVAKKIVNLAIFQNNIGNINICSGNPISIRSLVEKWLEERSYEMKLNFGSFSYAEYEPMAFWGENSKI
jgi:nucleoside-diphosphate-sugar epimerase